MISERIVRGLSPRYHLEGEDDGEIDEFADGGRRERSRSEAWERAGLGRRPGSPELSDHQSAMLLIEATCLRYAMGMTLPFSRRIERWETLSGAKSRQLARPTRSTRYGHRPKAEQNLRCYLYAKVLGLSLAEIGRRVGLKKNGARRASLSGARVAAAMALAGFEPGR